MPVLRRMMMTWHRLMCVCVCVYTRVHMCIGERKREREREREIYGQGVNGHNGVYDPAVSPTDFHKGSYLPLWLFCERAEREGVRV